MKSAEIQKGKSNFTFDGSTAAIGRSSVGKPFLLLFGPW